MLKRDGFPNRDFAIFESQPRQRVLPVECERESFNNDFYKHYSPHGSQLGPHHAKLKLP